MAAPNMSFDADDLLHLYNALFGNSPRRTPVSPPGLSYGARDTSPPMDLLTGRGVPVNIANGGTFADLNVATGRGVPWNVAR